MMARLLWTASTERPVCTDSGHIATALYFAAPPSARATEAGGRGCCIAAKYRERAIAQAMSVVGDRGGHRDYFGDPQAPNGGFGERPHGLQVRFGA
jgi:hypothetical protein